MPKRGITGHDEWVITEALATALVALEQLPSYISRALIWTISGSSYPLIVSRAPSTCIWPKPCRLFPSLDRAAIYREYGLEEREV
jgi:hypothetical protein